MRLKIIHILWRSPEPPCDTHTNAATLPDSVQVTTCMYMYALYMYQRTWQLLIVQYYVITVMYNKYNIPATLDNSAKCSQLD